MLIASQFYPESICISAEDNCIELVELLLLWCDVYLSGLQLQVSKEI